MEHTLRQLHGTTQEYEGFLSQTTFYLIMANYTQWTFKADSMASKTVVSSSTVIMYGGIT